MKNRWKLVLSSALISLTAICSSCSMTVSAAGIAEIPSTEVESVYNLPVDSNNLEGWTQGPQIYSESGIVMDVDSGAILYAKNIDDRHYPASITKIMTALVALQNYDMTEIVEFTWDDIGFLEYGDAHIGIKPEEQVGMEDCMYGMLLASANEVSHAIGAHMEGGYEEFLRVMNEVSEGLGCQNSHWMNTHGLHDPEHYTSCRDMAIISSEVFQYDKFREITGTYQHTIPVTNITDETRTFQQNHKMLREWDDRYYEYCVGGKTGYTDQALTTLVTFATKTNADGVDVNLVAVVMRTHGGGNNAYVDTEEMLNYAFDNFSKVAVTKETVENENIASLEPSAYVMVPNGVTEEELEFEFEASESLGDKTGKVLCTYGTAAVGTIDVTMTDECYNEIHNIETIDAAEESDKSDKKDLDDEKKDVWVILVIAGAAGIVLIVVLFIVVRRSVCQKRLMKKRRRQRKMEQARMWQDIGREDWE